MSGTKHDEGKSEVGLVPWEALEEIGNAFGFGARVKGYGVYNFTKGLTVMRNLNAGIRHIYKAIWLSDKDEESSLGHLGHAGACISMAIWTLKNKPHLDDRFISTKEPEPKALSEADQKRLDDIVASLNREVTFFTEDNMYVAKAPQLSGVTVQATNLDELKTKLEEAINININNLVAEGGIKSLFDAFEPNWQYSGGPLCGSAFTLPTIDNTRNSTIWHPLDKERR